MKGVACSDEPTENYHLNLYLPSALQRVSGNCVAVWSATLLFQFTTHIVPFSVKAGSFFQQKISGNVLCYLLSSKKHTDAVSHLLVNTVAH